jgi:heavy metal sensor kinase
MFKSLRWRLQVWHAFVLLIVLTSFGAIVYDLQWKTRLQQIDAELNRITNSMLQRRPPGRSGNRRPRGRDEIRPGGESGTRSDQVTPAQPELANNDAASSRTIAPPDGFRPPGDRPPRMTPEKIVEEFEKLTHSDDDSQFFFMVIWDEKGEVHSSDTAPKIDNPQLKTESDGSPKRVIRERHGDQLYRELIFARKYDSGVRNYLIGQSLQNELAEHHQRGLLLIATGLVILAAGTLGGGWLSARAIRPITDMTAAAESISAQNLSQRINVKETDSELGNLANVLNKTFDRLQDAFERQQQFTADASHELRTPLSVIATHTELALSRSRTNEDYRAAIETCQRAAKRMKTLIDALLILARFESGAPSMKQDRLNLEPLVLDCVELVRPLATERGIEIESQTTACEVCGDWDRLSQVVTNLLSNAIRYNVDGGQVIVATRIDKESAVISVTDTGIGIAPDQLPHIFDRFYQVDKARSRAEGSCGLGLSICKTIVEAHGGTIAAISQPSVGTTIEVRLARASSTMPAERRHSGEENLVSSVSVS